MMRFLDKPLPGPAKSQGEGDLAVMCRGHDGKRFILTLRHMPPTISWLRGEAENPVVPRLPHRWVVEGGHMFPDDLTGRVKKVEGWLWLNRT